MNRKRVFTMITTRASSEYTSVALRSLLDSTRLVTDDLIVIIDNDHARPALPRAAPASLRLIENSAPLGFAENMNQGLRIASASKADCYLLNNDLVFSKDWIEPLELPQPTILSPLSNGQLNYNTDVFSTALHMQLSQLRGHEAGFQRVAEVHRARSVGLTRVLFLPFFCVKIPSAVLQRLGLLDAGFGRGGAEDYDYCLRALLAGFDCCYANQSYVLHFAGKSSWSGGEAQAATAARELQFREYFRSKWGDSLYQAAFDDAIAEQVREKYASEIAAGRHREIVLSLCPEKRPDILIAP